MEKTNIFTISAYNLTNDCEFECQESWETYYSVDDAVESACKLALNLSTEDDVYDITIFGGEYMDEDGNTLGEPFGIIAISNKDKQTTIDARLESGFVIGEVDGYVEDGKVDLSISKFIKNNLE